MPPCIFHTVMHLLKKKCFRLSLDFMNKKKKADFMLAFCFLLHHKPTVWNHAESSINQLRQSAVCLQRCSESLEHVYHIFSHHITDLPSLYWGIETDKLTGRETALLFVPIATDWYYNGCHIRFVLFVCCCFLVYVYPDDSIVILMFTLRNTNDEWNYCWTTQLFIKRAIELLF